MSALSEPGAANEALSQTPIAIIAGAGPLPFEAAAILQKRRPVTVYAIEGEAGEAPPGIETHRLGYGEIGRLARLVEERNCRDLLFLGAIRGRPDFRRILGDTETLRLIPKIVRAAVGGDDTLVRNVLALFEAEGYRVVSVAETVPELLAAPGPLSRRVPSSEHEADLALGIRYLDATSEFDVGQAAVVVEGRIVAVEGAEGTDAMLERCAAARAAKRYRASKGAGVLVKRAKRGQDMRADVPVVGAGTLEKVLEAKLGGIAVEAGRTIIAERERMAALADRARVFVVAR